jgi:predicted dehydrogenase
MKFGVTKAYGVGIIGYSIGRVHAHGWQGVGEVYHPAKALPKLVAIAGRSKDRVETEAKRYGFSRSYSDWRDLVKDKEVDIVDNCAPPYVHHDACIAAAEEGKHVICEKPMARSAQEAKEMTRAVEKAGVANMVGYNYRFVSAVALAKQMIEEGLLGKIYYYRGSYLNAAADYHRSDTPFDWHHSRELGGNGALWDLGTHAIDLARFLGGEFATVQSLSKNYVASRPEKKGSKTNKKVDVDDATVSAVSFRDGAIGILEASWVTPGREDYLAFEVYGSKGSVKFNLERINELEVYLDEGDERFLGNRDVLVLGREHPFMKRYWVNQAGGFSWENAFVNELNHYLERLVAGQSVAPEGATFVDGYRNCIVMEAMMESAGSGRRIDIAS